MILRPSLRHALVVSLAAVLIAVFLMSTRARGSETALCSRHAVDATVRAQIVTGAGRPVTVIGDSWTVGLGLSDLEHSWPSQLPARVTTAGFSGSGFSRHASHCGDRAFATRASAARGADLVIVAGGLNDFDQPTADIRSGFRSLISSLGSRPVVVVGPASAPSRASSVGRVSSALTALSEEYGVAFIDTRSWPLSYLPDRLHLTAAGHAAYGERVADELAARSLLG